MKSPLKNKNVCHNKMGEHGSLENTDFKAGKKEQKKENYRAVLYNTDYIVKVNYASSLP